jgi:predicted nuclease of predicted toxin-antitoxin system
MRLALDHHYSPTIAEHLRDKGHDVVAAIERGWEREADEPLLALCAAEQRSLVTNNVSDFTAIARHWAAQGRSHCGLVFTSDARLPRSRATIGRYVNLLHDLLISYADPDGMVDRIHWL